jgi:fructose-bisphosphate aldolase class 1
MGRDPQVNKLASKHSARGGHAGRLAYPARLETRAGCRGCAILEEVFSLSRALLEDLRRTMTDDAFDRALSAAVDQIYRASTEKE